MLYVYGKADITEITILRKASENTQDLKGTANQYKAILTVLFCPVMNHFFPG